MGLLDPTSGSDVQLNGLAPRVDGLHGKRIGLYDNGKMAAEPVLEVLEGKLRDRYENITISRHAKETKHDVEDPEKLAAVSEWANEEELDACIGAIGDCGSCTKLLTWGMAAVEEVGVPTVGLIDEGFELDWQSNAIERGWPLRYEKTAVRSEVRDHELIAERMTPDALAAIEDELTRPLSETETNGTRTDNRTPTHE